jgi:hypothetical protein
MAEETRQQRRERERREGIVRRPATYSAREVVRIAIGSGGTGLVIGLIGGSFSAAPNSGMGPIGARLFAKRFGTDDRAGYGRRRVAHLAQRVGKRSRRT